MNSPTTKEVVSHICEIGALPQTLASVLEVLDDPAADADKIAGAISQDVSLTARVLRMVNSAHYYRSRKVTKISEAVAVVGLNSIKILTLSSSVFGMIPDRELTEKCDFKRIWRHLIETAINARNIAEVIKYREPEEAFVAGILHDVGIIIMLLYFGENYLSAVKKMKEQRCGLTSIEKKEFGFTHGDVGAELVDAWKFPPRLIYVIQNHHKTDEPSIIEEDSILNNIVALADRLTSGPIEGCFPEIEDNIMSIHYLQEKLKLSGETTSSIRKKSARETLSLAAYLELDVGDLVDILVDANVKLAELYFSLEKIYFVKKEDKESEPKSECEVVA